MLDIVQSSKYMYVKEFENRVYVTYKHSDRTLLSKSIKLLGDFVMHLPFRIFKYPLSYLTRIKSLA